MRTLRVLLGGAVVALAGSVAVALLVRSGDGTVRLDAAPTPDAQPQSGWILLEEARGLLDQGAGPEAERLYQQALAAFQVAELPAGKAHAAFGLGRANHLEGQSDDARRWYAEALASYTRADRAADQARVLAAMGDLERNTFHAEEAAELYRRAREVWRSAPEPKADAHPLLSLEAAPRMPDGEARARAILEESAAIYDNIGDPAGLSDVQMMLGALEMEVGDVSAAAVAFRAARERYVSAGALVPAAESALRQAAAEIKQGFNLEADATLSEALALFATAGDATGTGRTTVARGGLQRQLGHMEDAARSYREALAQLPPDAATPLAQTQVQLGQVEAWRGNRDAAREAFVEADRLYGELADVGGSGAASLGLGLLAIEMNDPGSAKELLSVAAERFAQAGMPLSHGRTLLGLAEIAEGPERGVALDLYQRAAALFAEAEAPFGELVATVRAAELARSGGADRFPELRRRALELRQAIKRPVAEANRLLELPAAQQLDIAVDPLDHHFGLDAAAQEALAAARAENLARHPDHNREARDLVAATDQALRTLDAELPR